MAYEEKYMKMAIKLAEKGRGKTNPNPMVGAVLVKNKKVIGRGYHKKAGFSHAEVNALKKAGKKVKHAEMYVTLEPCCHKGKTSPCTDSIIKSEVEKVYVGMTDPNPLVSGKGINTLRRNRVKVEAGFLAGIIQKQNEIFIKYITTKKPFVILKSALSIDGIIADSDGNSKWISGKESRKFVQKLRNEVDAIMVGVGTVIKDNPMLTVRIENKNKDPLRVILDSKARIPIDSKIVQTSKGYKTIVAVTDGIQNETRKALEAEGVIVESFKKRNGQVSISEVLKYLGKIGVTSVLIEGGSRLNSSFIESDKVDKYIFFIAPLLIGGKGSISVFSSKKPIKLKRCKKLSIDEIKKIERDVIITAYPA